jgi:hypothetical protein
MFYYYLLACTLYLGFFKLPFTGLGNDLIFIPLLVYAIFSWKQFFINTKGARFLILIWTVFTLFYIILLISSEKYYSKLTPILNIRTAYPFLMFYITLAVVNTKQKLIIIINYFLFLSVVASGFAVAQSIYGFVPMFDIQRFYDIGHWEGQNDQMIGPIARVMLPTIYEIYIVFIALLLYLLIAKRRQYLPLLLLLVVPILISYARSMWLAISISLFLSILILSFMFLISKRTIIISVFASLTIIAIIIYFLSLNNPISSSLHQRFISIYHDVALSKGTFAMRLNSSENFLAIWKTNGYYIGIDPLFVDRFKQPTLADVGYVYVLVTKGLIGLILYSLIWFTGILYAFNVLRMGARTHKIEIIAIGIMLFSSIIYFIISQVYTQYEFTSMLFGLICSLAVVSTQILNDQAATS